MHSHVHHDHQHSSAPESYNMAFSLAIIFNAFFIAIEVFYAISAGSMSLLADAGHNLGDVLGLLLAWAANWLLSRNPTELYSYGHKKTSVVAALINALILVATSAVIAYESILKMFSLTAMHEPTVMVVAFIGILINGGTALLFMRGRKDDLNIRGAFLHLAYDALISLGVVVSAGIIYVTGWQMLDPIVGLGIVVTILLGSWELLRNSVYMILDAVPHGMDQSGVRKYLLGLEGVKSVHDLHIWGLSTREIALTAHLVMPGTGLSDKDFVHVNQDLQQRFAVGHVTIQVEQGNDEYLCRRTHRCC